MYVRHTDLARQNRGFFSREHLAAVFKLPETYWLQTTADFNKHKEEFRMTGRKLFPGSTYRHSALLILPGAFYRKTQDVDHDSVAKDVEERLKEFERNLPRDLTLDAVPRYRRQKEEIYKEGSRQLRNAILYDASGSEIALYSPEEFAQGTRLVAPIVLFARSFDLVKLEAHGLGRPKKEREPESLLESLTRLSPQFA